MCSKKKTLLSLLLRVLKSVKTLRILVFIFAVLCFTTVLALSVLGVLGETTARFFLFGAGFILIFYALGVLTKDADIPPRRRKR